MTYEEMFNRLDAGLPQQQQDYDNMSTFNSYEPTFYNQPMMTWEETFNGFKSNPVLYNIEGYISPFSSNNWGGTSGILKYIDDSSRLPALDNKIDPNKIFSSEISACRSLASDQQRITKLFEKRLMESLNEKGKVGLTEEDVEAMAALTSARSAIASINKQQVDIKKNIAEIRIKQNQNGNTSGQTDTVNRNGGSVMDTGRSILDNIFNVSGNSSNTFVQNQTNTYQPTDVNQAMNLIDGLVQNVNNNIRHENAEVFVVVGNDDTSARYEAYEGDNIVEDYEHPTAPIVSIDRVAKTAMNALDVQYTLKIEE